MIRTILHYLKGSSGLIKEMIWGGVGVGGPGVEWPLWWGSTGCLFKTGNCSCNVLHGITTTRDLHVTRDQSISLGLILRTMCCFQSFCSFHPSSIFNVFIFLGSESLYYQQLMINGGNVVHYLIRMHKEMKFDPQSHHFVLHLLVNWTHEYLSISNFHQFFFLFCNFNVITRSYHFTKKKLFQLRSAEFWLLDRVTYYYLHAVSDSSKLLQFILFSL